MDIIRKPDQWLRAAPRQSEILDLASDRVLNSVPGAGCAIVDMRLGLAFSWIRNSTLAGEITR